MPAFIQNKDGGFEPFSGDISGVQADPLGYFDIIGASYRQENAVGSYVSQEENLPDVKTAAAFDIIHPEKVRPNFTQRAIDDGMDEDYLIKYENVRTDAEYSALTAQINKEKQDRETISKAPASTQMLANLTAGVTDLDPLMLVPAFGLAKKASKVVNVAQDVSKFAAMGAGSALATEAALQSTQETRDENEYYYALIGGAVLGGGLGGAVSAFRKSPNIDTKALETDLGREIAEGGNFGSSSASAAEAKKTTLEQEGIAGGKVAKTLANISAKDRFFTDNPVNQGLTSQSKTMRRITQELAETAGMKIAKAEEGIAVGDAKPAIETLNKIARGAVIEANTAAEKLFTKMRTGQEGGVLTKAMIGAKDLFNRSEMNYREFQRQVGHAMRNGDKHDIPEVAQAAKTYRSKVLDPLQKEAEELGLLPEGITPETASSYFTRIYNHDAIMRDPNKFDQITYKWLKEQQTEKSAIQDDIVKLSDDLEKASENARFEIIAKLEGLVESWKGRSAKAFKAKGKTGEMSDELQAAIKKIKATPTNLEDAELLSLAGEIRSRILSTPDGRLPYDKDMKVDGSGKVSSTGFLDDANKPGMFKQRAFAIPDNLISEFTINDADEVISGYMRKAKPYFNMYRRFNGDTELKGIMKDMEFEKNELLKGKKGKEAGKIEKNYKRDIKNLVALRQRALGYDVLQSDPTSTGARVSRGLRSFNLITLLGGMTVSAIPDIGRLVVLSSPVLKDALKPIIKNLITGDSKIVWDKFREMREVGVVAEIVSNNRAMQMGDIADDVQARTRIERGIEYAADKFGIASLMSPWNEALKQIAAISTESTIYNLSKKMASGKMSQEEISIMANNRIDKDMAQRIVAQFNKHGETHKELPLMNAQQWDDAQAKEAFLSALTQEVDRVILTPGYDKSVTMNSSEVGKLFWQFKSFFAKATTNILIRGAQDGATLKNAGQFVTMMGLGMMVYAIKTKQANRELSDNPAIWLVEGFDRAGIGGIFSEVHNISEKAAGVGVRTLMGGGVASRYASRSSLDAIMGPSYGMAANLFQLSRVLGTGEVSESDVNTVLRMIPGQNLPYVKPLRDMAKEEIADALK